MIELAWRAGGIIVGDGLRKAFAVQAELAGQLGKGVGLSAGKDGRHKVADGFAVDDRVADLPGLVGDQPAPDGIAFGPEIFSFIVKTVGIAVDHYPQRHAVDAGTDPAIVERRPGAMATQWDCEGSPIISAPARS